MIKINFSFRKITAIFLAVWIIIWINFIIRDLTRKEHFRDYYTLLCRNAESKRSYVYGDYFFELLEFSKNNLPQRSTYNIIGVKDYSIEWRRATYYLYPHREGENPDFLLVFNAPGYRKDGYKPYKTLDDSRFILKKAL